MRQGRLTEPRALAGPGEAPRPRDAPPVRPGARPGLGRAEAKQPRRPGAKGGVGRLAARAAEVARAFEPLARALAGEPSGWLGLWLEGARAEPPSGAPAALRQALEGLGPVYIKAGQLLSTRPDLLAQPYLDELASLHARVPPMPAHEVEACLDDYERELGGWPFSSFEPAPLAAASLAEVHRATLRDGTRVAVKLRRRGVEAVVSRDLELVALGARLFAGRAGETLDLEGLARELSLTLRDELDFRVEAEALALFERNLEPFAPLVFVPRVFEPLTTSAVLVTELVDGTPLGEPLPSLAASRRSELARATAQAYFTMFFVDGVFHADPHPGNLLITRDGRLCVLDFGMVGRIEEQVSKNLVRILLNFWLRDGHGVAHAFLDLGKPARDADELGWIMEVRRLLPRYHGVRLERLNLGTLLVELLTSAARCGVQAPPVVGLVCKSLANMDGAVRRLDPGIDVLSTFHAILPRIVEEHARRLASPERAAKLALDLEIGASRVPFQVGTILEKLATGRLRVVLDPLRETGRRGSR